jgi:hypothetical protein
MPRTSKRRQAISELKSVLLIRLQSRQLRMFLAEEDDESMLEDYKDLSLVRALEVAESRSIYKRDLDSNPLPVCDDSSSTKIQPWLNDEEFLMKYRVSRKNFLYVLNLIRDDPVFARGGNKKHDFSDFDDSERVPYEAGDVLNQGIPDGAPKDERRTRLLYYFEEHEFL